MAFWLFAALAIIVLNLTRNTSVRRYAWAAINLGFVALLLHGLLVVVAFAILAFYGLLRLIHSNSVATMTGLVSLFALLTLFVANKLGGGGLPFEIPTVLAAVGFSFVALRAFEVIRAVYERTGAPPDPIDLVNYLIPFHMLAAGPIQAFEEFRSAPTPPAVDKTLALEGLEAVARGLFKKFVVAFAVQSIFLNDFNSTGIHLLIEAMFFLFWLFLDFSAYSDIALGIGKLAGIHTPENFRNPLAARNLVDFWDRWHISLSRFIRRNIFIPIQLGLMRRTRQLSPLLIAALATTISFLLCGLWHGLTWGWLAWGIIHAAGLIGVRTYSNALSKYCTAQQMAAYQNSWLIRLVAQVLTYVYVSVAFLPVFLMKTGA